MAETQAKPRRGFPVENPTTAYWQAWSHRLADYRSSDTVPEHCDIAIIGTGLAGVATAYHILSSYSGPTQPSVVLLDARQACSGATGRNGGHTKVTISSAKRFSDTVGPEVAAELLALQAAQMYALKAVVEQEDIDCELLVTRSFDVLFDEEHARVIKEWIHKQQVALAGWSQNVQWLEGPNLERITGVKGIHGAVGVPAVSLWPYKLVMSLLGKTLALGAALYTRTQVQSITQDAAGANLLTTTRGSLRADKVVFATNGYSAALLPQYSGVITPIRGQASHLRPDPATHHGFNLLPTYNLHYDSTTADYLNPRPDGTIVLGGGQGHYRVDKSKWWDSVDDSALISDAVTDHFNSVMEDRFRGWEMSNAKADFVWTGIMGSTPDSLPHVGRVPGSKNQWILAGFNGGGMSMIFTLSQGIAKMVVEGVDYEAAGMPISLKTTQERMKNRVT